MKALRTYLLYLLSMDLIVCILQTDLNKRIGMELHSLQQFFTESSIFRIYYFRISTLKKWIVKMIKLSNIHENYILSFLIQSGSSVTMITFVLPSLEQCVARNVCSDYWWSILLTIINSFKLISYYRYNKVSVVLDLNRTQRNTTSGHKTWSTE